MSDAQTGDIATASNNIAALLTPVGTSAIATIRLIGPRVGSFLKVHFTRQATTGRAVHGDLIDAERVVDDPLVTRIAVDAVDIHVHGGAWVIERTLQIAAESGFERAATAPLPGMEYDTEIEREVLDSLPSAPTEEAVRLLLHQPAAWIALLKSFPARHEVERVLCDRSLDSMLCMPRVAIVGPANVGKSTLANHLFGQQRSITADRPGTTRDWVGEIANLDGLAVMLLDTPGVRTSDDQIEMIAIARAHEQLQRADLVIVVSEADSADGSVVDRLLQANRSAIQVINKIDRWPSAVRPFRDGLIGTNGLSGEGVDKLRRAIRSHFGCEPIDVTKTCCWTNRQRRVLQDLIK